jgi:hypothetical protein
MKVEQGEPANLLAMVAAEEVDQPMGGRDIGSDRVRRTAAAMGKMTRPTRRKGPRRMLLPF